MSVEASVVELLSKKGYMVAFENNGKGGCEILASCAGHDEEYQGSLSGAAGWARGLPSRNGPVVREEPIATASALVETVPTEEEWDKKWGNLTQEDVQELLNAQRAKASGEAPPAQEEDVAIEVIPSSIEKDEKEKEMKLFSKKSKDSSVVDISIPTAVVDETISVISTAPTAMEAAVRAVAEQGKTECKVVQVDYTDARGKTSWNRNIRVITTTESRIVAYDISFFMAQKEKLNGTIDFSEMSESEKNRILAANAQSARLAAKREFVFDRVVDARLLDRPVAPFNTGALGGGNELMRPTSDDAIRAFGLHPKVVRQDQVSRFIDAGWEVIPVGQ